MELLLAKLGIHHCDNTFFKPKFIYSAVIKLEFMTDDIY